jgi:hypothetical protein
MLTVAQLNPVYSQAIGKPLPTVRMMARRFVDDAVFPKGSGRRVPYVTHEQAALFLLAVLAAPAVKDATRTAIAFGALVHNGIGDTTALQAVTDLLLRLPNDPFALDWSLVVCKNFPQVVLKQKRFSPQILHPSERTDYGDIYIAKGEDWAHWPSDDAKDLTELPGIRLHTIARALAGND